MDPAQFKIGHRGGMNRTAKIVDLDIRVLQETPFIFKQGGFRAERLLRHEDHRWRRFINPDQYTCDPTCGKAGRMTVNMGQAVGVFQFAAGGSVINVTDGYKVGPSVDDGVQL